MQENQQKYLTIKDLSKMFHIGINKAYSMVQIPGFPFIKLGKQYLIPSDKLDKWINQNIGNEIELFRK